MRRCPVTARQELSRQRKKTPETRTKNPQDRVLCTMSMYRISTQQVYRQRDLGSELNVREQHRIFKHRDRPPTDPTYRARKAIIQNGYAMIGGAPPPFFHYRVFSIRARVTVPHGDESFFRERYESATESLATNPNKSLI